MWTRLISCLIHFFGYSTEKSKTGFFKIRESLPLLYINLKWRAKLQISRLLIRSWIRVDRVLIENVQFLVYFKILKFKMFVHYFQPIFNVYLYIWVPSVISFCLFVCNIVYKIGNREWGGGWEYCLQNGGGGMEVWR